MSIFAPAGSLPPVEKKLSAGRAWLMSLVAPGAGQIYCDAHFRGIWTLIIFLCSIAALIFINSDFRWNGLRMAMILYAFAGIDAYLTAREHNEGIDTEASNNPRVASVLNLTTNGFGYMYLGQKGAIYIVIAVMGVWRIANHTLPMLAEMVAFGIAVHAYRKGQRLRAKIYPAAQKPAVAESRIPLFVPIIVSMIVLGAYYALVTVGQIALLASESG
jgi:TM2 domain-containing membrane protein YozV